MTKSTKKSGAKKAPSKPDQLTPVQLKTIDLILSGKSLLEVATTVGRCRQTVSEWKNQNPLFRAKLEALRDEAEEDLHYALPMMESFMLTRLCRLAQDGPPEVQMKAIQYFMERVRPSDRDGDRNNPLLRTSNQQVRDALDQIYSREPS